MTSNELNNPVTDDCQFCMEHLEEAAMRTLEPDMQQRMESHLARCQLCRAELALIEKTLQLFAHAVEQVDPRPGAGETLMARFEAERDHPQSAKTTSTAAETARSASRMRLPRYSPWSYGGIFAGLLVALLVIGVWSFAPFQTSNGDLPRGQIQVMAMETTCQDCGEDTGGQIGADPKEKDGLVVAWNLDPQRKHEVWCVNRDGLHTKVGDLNVAETGSVMQTVSFPDAVGGYHKIYVIRDDGFEELSVVPSTSHSDGGDVPASPAATEE